MLAVLLYRYPKLHRQFHHRELRLRREAPHRTRISEQTKLGLGLDPEARMAAQLAHLYQRDYFLLPCQPLDL